jgi:hypothetical protein
MKFITGLITSCILIYITTRFIVNLIDIKCDLEFVKKGYDYYNAEARVFHICLRKKDIKKTYFNLHQQGYVSSAETWQDGQLVGGLYGIRIGNVFCGESMFSLVNNASKYAFINYVQLLKEDGVQLIDCQIYTPHLESLGGKMIPLKDYLTYLPA